MINRLSLSFVTLFIGFLFYTYRSYFSDFIFDSGATFLHVIALTLLSSNFVKENKNIKYMALLWLVINIGFEYAQGQFMIGTFDYLDMLAAFLALPFAYVLARYSPRVDFFVMQKKAMFLLSLLFGSSLIMGSYTEPYEPYCKYDFVYQDLETFRGSVVVQTPEEIGDIASTHIYGEYILLVETGKGIHIYDQSSVSDIQNISFIKIPGVLHIEVQNQRIYADSLIDLVVLDITDIENISIDSRVENIFDYNPWDIVSVQGVDRYEFCEYPSYDYKTDGVAVSYKESVQ